MLRKRGKAIVLTSLLAVSTCIQANACAPEFPVAVLVNRAHPDIPLSLFAAGKIGIVKSSWAKSYLCVVYRYLTNNPLSQLQQESILELWHKRLHKAQDFLGDGDTGQTKIGAYLKLRNSVAGAPAKNVENQYYAVDNYSYLQNIGPDAFSVATATLRDRIKQFGLHSKEVREWVRGQDVVFGVGAKSAKSPEVPSTLGDQFASIIRADRNYQIAAAVFYSRNYDKAAQLFQSIASDPGSPWHKLATYLALRAQANKVLFDADTTEAPETIDRIKSLLRTEKDKRTQADLLDLLIPLQYKEKDRQQILQELIASVTNPHSSRFGGDVGDLTFTMDDTGGDAADATKNTQASGVEKLLTSNDLTDWLTTIQTREDTWFYGDEAEQKKEQKYQLERAAHAIAQWRKDHKLHWLVALMCTNGLRSTDLNDAFTAANKIPQSSPAYLTASFYINDALIAQHKNVEARRRLTQLLSKRDLSPSDRNLFQAQALAVAGDLRTYLSNAIMVPPVIDAGMFQLPSDWPQKEKLHRYYSDTPVLDQAIADDLNRYLPLSVWYQMAEDKRISPAIRARIIRATWLRAALLKQTDIVQKLSPELAKSYPSIASLIDKYSEAQPGEAKNYALARVVLKTYGMTPYVEAGVERHGRKIDQFDYYNANYWRPLNPNGKSDSQDQDYYPPVQQPGNTVLMQDMQSYYKRSVFGLLNIHEQAASKSQLVQLWRAHPAAFLGDAVIQWSKTHPNAPDLPELLYKVNRLPKWSFLDTTGSKYSHTAYNILHKNYPNSAWAKKAVCWY